MSLYNYLTSNSATFRRIQKRFSSLRRYPTGKHTYGNPLIVDDTFGKRGVLEVGAFCSFAPKVTILLGAEHRIDWVSSYPFPMLWKQAKHLRHEHPISKGRVIIGNDVWVGYGATILSGITIGDGAVIAAQTVVTKDVEPYSIVAGNPARHIKLRFAPEEIKRIPDWWHWSDRDIANRMDFLCRKPDERNNYVT